MGSSSHQILPVGTRYHHPPSSMMLERNEASTFWWEDWASVILSVPIALQGSFLCI
jgi:hypothetical protein